MTCRDVTDFLMDYLAGQLPAEALDAFERHVARCANCHVFIEQYRLAIRAGREAFADPEAGTVDVPEDLVRAIRQALAGARRGDDSSDT
jgi:anti-sigma factor RsiW